jgi:hypothetical protein
MEWHVVANVCCVLVLMLVLRYKQGAAITALWYMGMTIVVFRCDMLILLGPMALQMLIGKEVGNRLINALPRFLLYADWLLVCMYVVGRYHYFPLCCRGSPRAAYLSFSLSPSTLSCGTGAPSPIE